MTSKATPNLDTLINLLRRDPQRNINLLHFIADYAVTGYERAGDSLLVRSVSDRPWVFVSSSSEAELRQLARKLRPEDTHFAAVEAWMIPILAAGRKIGWDLSMMQFILPVCAPKGSALAPM